MLGTVLAWALPVLLGWAVSEYDLLGKPAHYQLFVAVCAIVGGVLTAVVLIVLKMASMYPKLISGNGFDLDTYVADPSPSILSRAKVVFIHYFIKPPFSNNLYLFPLVSYRYCNFHLCFIFLTCGVTKNII